MDNNRMSTADMLQYCEEALAWEDFGPIDIFFFQSVKKILLGQCSAIEAPEPYTDDLMGIERPVRDVELEPEYGNYADISKHRITDVMDIIEKEEFGGTVSFRELGQLAEYLKEIQSSVYAALPLGEKFRMRYLLNVV